MKEAGELCRTDPTLRAFAQQVEKQEQLFAETLAQIPVQLRKGCLSALLKGDGTLVIFVSSPAWSYRLRFFEPKLRRAFASKWGVRRIRCQVVPQEHQEPPPSPVTRPSPEALSRMEEEIERLEDSELKAAMERMVKALRDSGKRPPEAG